MNQAGKKPRRVLGRPQDPLPSSTEASRSEIPTSNPSDYEDTAVSVANTNPDTLIITDPPIGPEPESFKGTNEEGLSCPICGESMVTLLQLNRHLDDAHSGQDKVKDEQIKSWFRQKVEQARQIQSVASVLPTSFTALGLFEDDKRASTPGTGTSSPRRSDSPQKHQHQHQRQDSSNYANANLLTEDRVTRRHWQKSGDRCSDLVCDKALNARNGAVNCRSCGKLFCNSHSAYRMKLDEGARPDPSDKGIWCRVCETCFKSRPGYNDSSGCIQDTTEAFLELRQKNLDSVALEVNRLEKRLVRLMEGLARFGGVGADDSSLSSGIFNYARLQQRKQVEQSITNWQDESGVTACGICQSKFGFSLRKHHCRICGKVVCASEITGCSKSVQLDMLAEKLDNGVVQPPESTPPSDLSIRMCSDCKNLLFAKQNFAAESQAAGSLSLLLKHYDALDRLQRSIEQAMPRFQGLVLMLNDTSRTPGSDVLAEASSVRKKLLDDFRRYDGLARKLLACRVGSESERRIQKQMYSVAAQFLQDNMLPLKSLPQALKHTQAVQAEARADAHHSVSPEAQETIDVMQQQKTLIMHMIEAAKKDRRLDEVAVLSLNLKELDAEIERLSG